MALELSVIAGLIVGIAFVAAFSIMFPSPSPAPIIEGNQIQLSIEGLQSTYKVGERIIFGVSSTGISDNACNIHSPGVVMRDNDRGKTLYWPNPGAIYTAMGCNGADRVDRTWTFGDDIETETILEKAGSYTMVASLEDATIEKQFFVTN